VRATCEDGKRSQSFGPQRYIAALLFCGSTAFQPLPTLRNEKSDIAANQSCDKSQQSKLLEALHEETNRHAA